MATKIELQNYQVSIKSIITNETILEIFVQAFKRFKGDFMLQELYQKWSSEYQKEEYPDTIEIKQTRQMELEIRKLISRYGEKTNYYPPKTVDSLKSVIHLHEGKDDWYLCYPPRIDSWEDAERVIKNWFSGAFLQIKTGFDPNGLESFGRFLLNSPTAHMIVTAGKISFFNEYPKWIEQYYEVQVVVQKMDGKNLKSIEKMLSMLISESEFSVRTMNCLNSEGIKTVWDLTNMSRNDLLRIHNLSKRSYDEISNFLKEYGLALRAY